MVMSHFCCKAKRRTIVSSVFGKTRTDRTVRTYGYVLLSLLGLWGLL